MTTEERDPNACDNCNAGKHEECTDNADFFCFCCGIEFPPSEPILEKDK